MDKWEKLKNWTKEQCDFYKSGRYKCSVNESIFRERLFGQVLAEMDKLERNEEGMLEGLMQ